jgi:hypothetical protein
MTREELENLCDVVATVEVDWIVRTSFSRAIRDHDQAQRRVIESQDKLIEATKDLGESLKQVIEQQATELTCWRETAKAVGAVDDHALALHLDEQAQEIGRLKEALQTVLDAWVNGRIVKEGIMWAIRQQAEAALAATGEDSWKQ